LVSHEEEHIDKAHHIEDQAHDEDHIGESTQASTPSFHEDKGLISHDLLHISKFNDVFIEDLEEDMFEDEHLKNDTC